MPRVEKTVFICYRRTNFPWAKLLYEVLTHRGFDVFIDYTKIGPGAFETVILENISTRVHFLVMLTPSALERTSDTDDWMRREIEHAMAQKRNIVPLMLEGFDFGMAAIQDHLTGSLAGLDGYTALTVSAEYCDAAIEKLCTQFLDVPLESVVHPRSAAAERGAAEQRTEADASPAVRKEELSAQVYFERAYAATDPNEKIRLYTEALRLDPGKAVAHYNRGVARKDRGDPDGAIEDFGRAISIDPEDAMAYNNRGTARHVQGDIDGAIEDWDKAISIDPEYAGAYYNRGNARRPQGDIDGAIEDYDRAISIDPEYAGAYNNRGVARKDRGDLDGAIEDYDRAISIDPEYAGAYNNRGNARHDQGDIKGAIADYDKAISIYPESAGAHYNRGEFRQDQGDIDGAIEDYQRYLDLGGGVRHGDQEEVEQLMRDLKAKK